jgi:CheY-like chemotaxis protein
MKILIIDDEPHIRHMMRITLEAAGYQVDEAPDGEAGLARFGDGSEYDAVVLDQKMPGLDGLVTLQRIKGRAPDAAVLMATAFASIELAVDAMRLGATDFLRKPMTPETLRGAVAASIDGRHQPRGQRRSTMTARPSKPEIETITLNGFRIRSPDPPTPPTSFDHGFRVTHFPDPAEFTVTVTVDRECVERVARLTRRRLEPGGMFWRMQAERLLSAYLWSEGRTPENRRLVVRDVSRDDIDVAAAWEDD